MNEVSCIKCFVCSGRKEHFPSLDVIQAFAETFCLLSTGGCESQTFLFLNKYLQLCMQGKKTLAHFHSGSVRI